VLAFGLLPIALLIERWKPADQDQPAFGAGMTVDGLWFLLFPIVGVALADWVDGVVKAPLREQLDGFSVLTALPVWAQLLAVILMSDFLAWMSHYIRHKVPLFWEFHKIHHSQAQLNFFTAKRLHPLDLVVNGLIRFLPWTLLGMNVAIPGYVAFALFVRMYEMFVHSNIRMNWGVLRFVLVTPQSHRLHHSLQPEHIDVNFGDFLSIWDWMFGTQCRDKDIYPKTGIHDSECSRGTAPDLWAASRRYLGEMVYPIRVIFRWIHPSGPR
jgi:sterol desaturase/sphingolipid hydroxylase (fatty acid hydroxylase superfamily)